MRADEGFRLAGLRASIAWYVSSAGARTVLSLSLLPIYLSHLTPGEFGELALATVVISLVKSASGLGAISGMARHVTEALARGEFERARGLTGTALTLTQVGACLGAFVLCLLAASTGPRLVGGDSYLYGAVVAAILVGAPADVLNARLRAAGQARVASLVASATQASIVVASAVLLVGFDGGPVELIAVNAIVAGVTSLALGLGLRHDVDWRYSRHFARVILRFGAPTIPALLSDWVVQFSDRMFLNAFVGLDATGVYSLASRVAQALNDVLATGLYQAWSPYVFATFDAPGAAARLSRITTYFGAIAMAFAVALIVGAVEGLRILGSSPYANAGVALGTLTFGFWFALMRLLFLAPGGITKRTEANLPSWLGGMSCNLILNFALIPPFGIEGAAIATLASYAVAAALAVIFGRRLWPIEYEWGRLAAIVVVGLTVVLIWCSVPLPIHPVPAAATLTVTSVGAFAGLLWFGGFLRSDERASCVRLARGLVRRGA